MALFAGVVESLRTATTTPWTWSHNVAVIPGVPRGVLVAVLHGGSATDHVTGITYGGVPLTRVQRNTDAATEAGAAEWWFRGTGIPTGIQSVTATLASATTDDIHFVSILIRGDADIAVINKSGINDNAANPSVTLPYGSRTAMAFAAFYSGLSTIGSITAGANCEVITFAELPGNFTSVCLRQSTEGVSDFTIAATASSDDVAFAVVAVGEVAAVTPGAGSLRLDSGPRPGTQALALQGAAPTVEALSVVPTLITPAVGTLAVAGAVPAVYITLMPSGAALALEGTGVVPRESSQQQAITPAAGLLNLARSSSLTPASAAALALVGRTPQLALGGVVDFDRHPTTGLLRLSREPVLTPTTGELILLGSLAAPGPSIMPSTGALWFGEGTGSVPAAGALALAGAAPGLGFSAQVPDAAGLALVGLAAQTRQANYATPAVTALTVTGLGAIVQMDTRPSPGTAELIVIGEDEPAVNRAITPVVGALTLPMSEAPFVQVGNPANTQKTGTPGHLTFEASAPIVTTDTTNEDLAPAVAALVLVGVGATAVLSSRLIPITGAAVLNGLAPMLPARLEPATALLVVSGDLPLVGSDHVIETFPGALSLAATAPGIGSSQAPVTGALVVAGSAVTTPLAMPVPAGTLALVASVPFVQVATPPAVQTTPSTAVLALEGAAPALQTSSTAILVSPETGTLDLFGEEPPAFIAGTRIVPPSGALILLGRPSLDTVFREVFVVNGRSATSALTEAHARTPELVEALAGVASADEGRGEA